jgi:hypothetical protein
MSITPVVFQEVGASGLEAALNTALAPLTSSIIFGMEIAQQKNEPTFTRNLSVAFTYESGGIVLPTPFMAHVVSESDDATAVLKIQEFIAANPTYFISEVYVVYRPHEADPNEAVVLVVFYNADVLAAANWKGGGSSGGSGGNTPSYEKVETIPSSGAGPVVIDFTTAPVYDITLDSGPAAIPLSFTGALPGVACSVMLILRQDAVGGRLVSWPLSFKWPGATLPVLTALPNGIDILAMFTVDGGTTWFGNPGLANLS